MWKESQRNCLRSCGQTTRVEPIKAQPRQVGPATAHISYLVNTCSPPGERFSFVTFPSPVVAVHFVLVRSFITHFRLFMNAFLSSLFWHPIPVGPIIINIKTWLFSFRRLFFPPYVYLLRRCVEREPAPLSSFVWSNNPVQVEPNQSSAAH